MARRRLGRPVAAALSSVAAGAVCWGSMRSASGRAKIGKYATFDAPSSASIGFVGIGAGDVLVAVAVPV